MHLSPSIVLVAFFVCTALAAVNEPCIGDGGAPGVCISTDACKKSGGKSIKGGCPSDGGNIQCCSKTACGSVKGANCRWKSDCPGKSIPNECPGPSQMMCCQETGAGFGNYDKKPDLPPVGACKKVAVDGAEKIVAAFPGRIRQIYCTRGCTCTSKSSDHCCGRANDLMCADGGGVPTVSGQEIAEWCMKHRKELNLKYVIWGQRIWNPSRDGEKPWTKWRGMEDRKDPTANHWDHVHVSYNA